MVWDAECGGCVLMNGWNGVMVTISVMSSLCFDIYLGGITFAVLITFFFGTSSMGHDIYIHTNIYIVTICGD